METPGQCVKSFKVSNKDNNDVVLVIVNFEQVSHIVLAVSIADFKQINTG